MQKIGWSIALKIASLGVVQLRDLLKKNLEKNYLQFNLTKPFLNLFLDTEKHLKLHGGQKRVFETNQLSSNKTAR